MTAYDAAIDAMARELDLGAALDAIPDNALLDLLVERGVLEPVTLPHGNHTISVYQRKDQR